MNNCSYETKNIFKKEITTMKKTYKIDVDCANCELHDTENDR